MKLQLTGLCSACPSVARIVVASAAVYVVESASAEVGVRVAVSVAESYATDAGTVVPSSFLSVKLDEVIVEASIAFEKPAVTVVDGAALVVEFAGVCETTVGGPVGALDGVISIAVICGSSAEP